MLIGIEKRFIFVANTKTASTAIERVLDPLADYRHGGSPQRKHVALSQIEAQAPWVFRRAGCGLEGFFKFGVMRDPVQWIWSWYRYRKQPEVESPLPADMTFAEFWARRDWNIVRANGAKNLQSEKFLSADRQTVLADVILPHEGVAQGFGAICAGLGLGLPDLPPANVSRQRSAPDIPAHLIDEVRAHYAEDYALLARLPDLNAAGMARLRAGVTSPG
ncbi:MAG: hypothetical protein H6900_02425 [Rhodobacter sp.]|uniref:hypothetical protein n=1 Tax=Pararhodobacter sp. TaxID=2127056 RepID=UPI001E0C60EB|nr:hypothetical protein [Pararhodobacter sp.]MCB1345716.1 hypothetical protein [Paracoccaceae bacterium]MCC0072124.1 hypothetical protein [Rhodobacter sp.]HPD91605.1 hypothetical protein [Pararhodobacter sp.]